MKIISPLSVVPKLCDCVKELFRGVLGVFEGRLQTLFGVSEYVLQCLLLSLVACVVLGVIGGRRGLVVYFNKF